MPPPLKYATVSDTIRKSSQRRDNELWTLRVVGCDSRQS